MELKYGNKRAAGISSVLSFVIYIATLIATKGNIVVTLGAGFVSNWSIRGVLRFLFCKNWVKVKASILEAEALPHAEKNSRGAATSSSQKRIRVQYSVEGKLYATDTYLNLPYKKENLFVYYNPKKPDVVCSNKGMGWEGIVFIASILLLTLYAFWPDLLIFRMFSDISNRFHPFKGSL